MAIAPEEDDDSMMPANRNTSPPENRGNDTGPAEPIPLTEMLERLAALGLPSAADRLDRWRDASILGPTLPAGEGNARLIAPLDQARLEIIAWLHREFGVQKIPLEELAFWLAAAGDRSMPPELVMDAIERCTKRFVNNLMGLLAKRVGGRWRLEEPDRQTVTNVSGSVVNSVKRMFRSSIELGAVWAMEAMLNAFLTQVLKPANEAGARKNITTFLKHVGASDAQITSWVPHVWEAIQELSTFVAVGDRNAFIIAAKACRDMHCEEATRLVQHAYRMYNMVLLILPELQPLRPARVMVPMIAGMLLHLRDNPAATALRNRMDDEGDAPLREAADQGITIRGAVWERFFGRKSEEIESTVPAPVPVMPTLTTDVYRPS